FSIAKSDGITAVSEYLRGETVDNFQLPSSAMEVIPNFVDPALYDRDLTPCRRQALAPSGEKLVIHISNFRAVKRVRDVVGVFAHAQREVPARLILVGDGPDRPAAQLEAEALGVSDRVTFLGKQDSVAEILACADLLLLPSQSESFGLVALEAMAAGVPVIATAVGGLPEVVEDGVTGFLRPVGAVEEMGDAALSLLRDPARWAAFSRAARSIAVERFSVDVIVPRYEQYYERVLAGHAAWTEDLPRAVAGS
ncbi:MAG: N-acetyl-alpha-D-glucosaminyl L-malate synthase BshA, partial [Gemmatimonadota bacterium]|nr:N-acetyl-alpha-D-glucosaminyl L-malate synthase BshA [Gemmatimonadota bacterium]